MLALSQVLLWVTVMIQGIVICVLIRQLGALRTRSESGQTVETWLAVGTTAPDFQASDMRSGAIVHSSAYSSGAVFCFVSSDCGTCRMLAADIARQSPERLAHLVMCCVGTPSLCRDFLTIMPSTIPVLLADDVEVGSRFRISAWPVAVVLDDVSRIAGYHYVASFDDVEPLLGEATEVAKQHALTAPELWRPARS